jgi:hypothetical protein
MVPCDIVKYLDVEYGGYDKWSIPRPIKYEWKNMEKNHSVWTNDEWPSVYKVYKPNGQLNIDDTIYNLNQDTKRNITKEYYMQLLNNNQIRELLTFE